MALLWGKHRVTETPGVTGAGKIRRALCYSQSPNPHGRECGHFPARKLHHCRIGVSSSILPAGQQQNLRVTPSLLAFLQPFRVFAPWRFRSALVRLRRERWKAAADGPCLRLLCRTANSAGPREMPQEICSPGQRETLGGKE